MVRVMAQLAQERAQGMLPPCNREAVTAPRNRQRNGNQTMKPQDDPEQEQQDEEHMRSNGKRKPQ